MSEASHPKDLCFEDTENWFPELKDRLVIVGKELYSSEGESAFPLGSLTEELETINFMLTKMGPMIELSWTYMCFLDMGLPHRSILEVYMGLVGAWHCQSWPKIVRLLLATSLLILSWGRSLEDHEENEERRSLIEDIRSGKIKSWLTELQNQVGVMSGHHELTPNGKVDLAMTRRRLGDFENLLTKFVWQT